LARSLPWGASSYRIVRSRIWLSPSPTGTLTTAWLPPAVGARQTTARTP